MSESQRNAGENHCQEDDLLPKEAVKDDESPKEPTEEKAAEPTDKTDAEKEAVAN